MLGVVLAAVLASPSPSAAPLKTIEHLYVSRFCTLVRRSVRPAVLALLQNKPAVGQGQSLFLDMAHAVTLDKASVAMHVELDIQRMSTVVRTMAQNLETTENRLRELQTALPDANQDSTIRQLRSQLEAIAAKQRDMLNVFSGTYYSYTSNELLRAGRGSFDAGETVKEVAESLATAAPAVPSPAGSPAPAREPQPGSTPVTIDIGLAGGTPFVHLFNTVTSDEVTEDALELRASQTMISAAAICR